ncbi:MAG: helix-hairpin-helix domain-containing protein [Candidatus Thorarchaeota archaeon]
MRYAYGIFMGAVFPGVIFLVTAAIRITGIGAPASVIEQLWEVYTLWFVASIAIAILPLLFIFITARDMVKEFLIYEAGGFGFFSPLWIFIASEISGDRWYRVLTNGITDGLIGFGPGGTTVGIDISNIFLVPFLAASFILGIIFLRPSFIAKYGGTGEIPELTELKEDAGVKGESASEVELPEVKLPEPTVDSVATLRDILMEHGTTDSVINLILNSGIGSTTDLAATSADQLATLTGLGKREAEELLMVVQKKMFFGDI